MQKVQFEYFYNDDSDQYSFYRIPKLLFTEEYFSSLSCEAKVLYGLMLDRMSLSLKNKWFDEQDRAYIIFTIEEIKEQKDWKQLDIKTDTRKKLVRKKALDCMFLIIKMEI